jgi:adenine phosphoribosyltransferase
MTDSRLDLIRSRVRDVPDFPKPGILFKDISPILADPAAFSACLDLIAERYQDEPIDAVLGVESRGFIFGAALAARWKKAFVPARKPGKLPWETVKVAYELEYGTDSLEVHRDAFLPGQRVLLVDDLIATGGTAWAATELVRRLGAEVVGAAFVIELTFLPGAQRLKPVKAFSLLQY